MEELLIEAFFFRMFQMACVLKARINPQFNRAGHPKGVAGFIKNETELIYTNIGKKVQPHQPSVINLQF